MVAAVCWLVGAAHGQELSAGRLGVLFNADEPGSGELARWYARERGVPPANVIGVHLPTIDVVSPENFANVRDQALTRLPTSVQSLLLVWSRPTAVGCMSITTAFAAGYRAAFCGADCGSSTLNPLYDTNGWLPADTVGWWPSMLLPTNDPSLLRQLVERGAAAGNARVAGAAGTAGGAGTPGGARRPGTLYLIKTQDAARNVRAAVYGDAESLLGNRMKVSTLSTPVTSDVDDAIGYFTGAAHVDELSRIRFLPGAVADHLTSWGGVLAGTTQMSALEWLKQGATGSYGTVSEPCNRLEKFPNPAVLFDHYLKGETLLESYWKSVAMPGQGLFIGEPLARAYPRRPAAGHPVSVSPD